jgi:pantoate--beta-alanine ligase
MPDLACFGQKDIQQVTLIRRMVRDLDWPIELLVAPTIREPDGLALSSRNVYLSEVDRVEARRLSKALRAAEDAWRGGTVDAEKLRGAAESVFREPPATKPDYVAIVDPDRFEPVAVAARGTVIAVAARVGSTRLIDNVILS